VERANYQEWIGGAEILVRGNYFRKNGFTNDTNIVEISFCHEDKESS
jgi:hypothetical protein